MIILRNGQYEEQSKFRRFLDKLNKKVSPGYKTNAEVLNEQKTKKEDFTRERLKEINPKLLVALDIQEKTRKFLPSWGDGDEYPDFHVTTNTRYEEDFGLICLGWQGEENYKWNKEKNCWEEINTTRYTSKGPRRVMNLKQDILKQLEGYRKEYSEINYLEDEETEDVLRYLDKLIEEVKRSTL